MSPSTSDPQPAAAAAVPQICENCAYYQPLDDKQGECHRYPPTGTWPYNNFEVVLATRWCGEFKKA